MKKKDKSEKSDIVLFTSLVSESERSELDNSGEACESDNAVALYSALAIRDKGDDEWFVDSGATKHMTNVDHEMQNVKKPSVKQVKAANGERMDIERTGDLKCQINNNSNFVLSDVQYIPKISVNLLSVSQMVKRGCTVVFDVNGCRILQEKQLLAEGKLIDDMFKIKIKFTENACATREQKNSDDAALWHRRMGHMSFGLLNSVLNLKVESDTKCVICAMGKHSRKPFNEPGTRATRQLELIHTDVCGPMPVRSLGGARYFVSFIDDFSRKVHIYVLKSKGEVFEKFVMYKKLVENQLDMKIKIVRSDNGTEFVNKSFMEFYTRHGIKQEKSTPYSPQQNGLAERMNRTIVEKVRCMLLDSKLAKHFWAEAVYAAVNVINAITNSSTKMSPNEKWNGTKSNFAEFKVFGCRAMAWQPNEKRKKLDQKSCEYIFLRNADDAKAYRLYDVNKRTIVISRDVIFLEREELVIDANNFNDNSHVYIPESERFEEISEPETDQNSSQTVDDPATIAPGESNNTNESTAADTGNVSQLNADADNRNDTLSSVDATFESANGDENNEAIDETLEETIIDAGARNSVADDPDFRTRARVDSGADRAVTRSLRNLLNFHMAFSAIHEPDTYQEAMNGSEAVEWKMAMREEFDSLIKNNTWVLMKCPPGAKIVDNRWVFKVKQEKRDAPIRYKARLVARGFTQEYGVNYFETFSPVVRFTSIRIILALAAQKKMQIKQFDVKTAFLNGDLDETVYMKQPIGFEDGSGNICKLQKSLYGLKQSSRCWNKKFTDFIRLFGFNESKYDPCVFIRRRNNALTIMAIHVDDGIIVSESDEDIKSVLNHLNRHFEVKEMEIGCFLGLEIQKNGDGSIFIHQSTYAEKVLNRFNFGNCHGISTPSDPNQSLHDFDESEPSNYAYRSLIGSLMYLAIGTRPDIAYAVSVASRFLEKPTVVHERAAKRILRYIKRTLNFGILYTQDSLVGIRAYSDADFAGDTSTRKSTSGSVLLYGNNVVSWSSERQQSVSLSTTESEYIAASQCVKELVWLLNLLRDILNEDSINATLFMDNQSAIRLVKNPEFHKRSKHIDIRYHFIREKYEGKCFKLEYISTHDMLADIFTKALPATKFNEFVNKLNVCEN